MMTNNRKSQPLVVLIGSPGSGKSTVGDIVSRRLGVQLRDTDSDIEQLAGKSVADIFITDGEPEFRRLEREAVQAALAEHEGVLSLGGGAPMQPSIQDYLVGHNVVFLLVSATEAAKRVGVNQSRPWLGANMPVHAHLRALLAERNPVYERLAWRTMVTDGRSAHEVADEIVTLVKDAMNSPAQREEKTHDH